MRASFFRGLVLAIAIVTSSQAMGDATDDCNSNDPALIISGCSEVINIDGLPDEHKMIALGRRSDAYIAVRNFDSAVADREEVLTLDPANQEYTQRVRDVLKIRADASLAAGKHNAAIIGYSRALDYDSSAGDVAFVFNTLLGRIEARLRKGLFQSALNDLSSIIELDRAGGADPSNNQVQLVRGLDANEVAGIVRLVRLYELKTGYFAPESGSPLWNQTYSKARDIISSSSRYNCRLSNSDGWEYGQPLDRTRNEPEICLAFHQLKIVQIRLLLAESKARIRSGRLPKASRIVGRVLELDSKNLNALLLKGLILEKQEKLNNAELLYAAVLEIDSDNRGAQEGLERLSEREKSIVRLIQLELTRLNCKPGPIDGIWGPKSREALLDVGKFSDKSLPSREPTQRTLDALSRFDGVDGCWPYE